MKEIFSGSYVRVTLGPLFGMTGDVQATSQVLVARFWDRMLADNGIIDLVGVGNPAGLVASLDELIRELEQAKDAIRKEVG